MDESGHSLQKWTNVDKSEWKLIKVDENIRYMHFWCLFCVFNNAEYVQMIFKVFHFHTQASLAEQVCSV